MGLILLIVLIVLLAGGFPRWRGEQGIRDPVGLLVLVLVVILLFWLISHFVRGGPFWW